MVDLLQDVQISSDVSDPLPKTLSLLYISRPYDLLLSNYIETNCLLHYMSEEAKCASTSKNDMSVRSFSRYLKP